MLIQSAFMSSYLRGLLEPNPSEDLWEMVCIWNPSEWSHPRSEGAEALFSNTQVWLRLLLRVWTSQHSRPSQLTLKMPSGEELNTKCLQLDRFGLMKTMSTREYGKISVNFSWTNKPIAHSLVFGSQNHILDICYSHISYLISVEN